MNESLPLEAPGGSDAPQQIDGVGFEEPGSDALLDVGARARLEDDRIDTGLFEEKGEREAGGACADDADFDAFHEIRRYVLIPVRATVAGG